MAAAALVAKRITAKCRQCVLHEGTGSGFIWEYSVKLTNPHSGGGSPRAVNTYTNTTTSSRQRKGGLLLLSVLCLCLGLNSLSAGERWETLQAIHWVENPRNSPKAGPCGELGAYQFREKTWKMHTQVPFKLAVNRSHSDEVAVRHYEWIKRGLVRAGLPVTPYNVALAWNGGLTATIKGRVPAATRDYAERVNNLAVQFGQARVVQDCP